MNKILDVDLQFLYSAMWYENSSQRKLSICVKYPFGVCGNLNYLC